MKRDLLKELRRYAGMGKKERVKSVLREMLNEEPDDCFAMAELKRLDAGKELYSTLDYKSYRRILDEASVESLHRLMQRYPTTASERMVKGKIKKILETVRMLEERLQDKQNPIEEVAEYKRLLRRELSKRKVRAGGRAAVLAGIPLAILFILGISVWQMRQRAESTAQALEKAVETEDWQRVQTLKESANSGINRLLYSPTEVAVNRAEAWIAHKKAIQREARKIIHHLQSGKYNITTMPLAQRALMERYLRSLPKELNDVSVAWNHYCNQAKQQWAQQIPGIIKQLQAPLPDFPAWQSDKDDARLAEQYCLELATRLKEYEDIVDAYRLNAVLLSPLRKRLDVAKRQRQEIETWQKTGIGISMAESYADYLRAIEKLGTPTAYPPAAALAKTMKNFPGEEDVCNLMRDPSGKTPPTLQKAMSRTLLQKGASFCTEGPASAKQVEMLDDLFTTRTLRTKLYCIRSAQGQVAYSTAPFEKEGDAAILVKRAELDPAFRIGKDPQEIWPAAGTTQQLIDTTGLVSVAGLERRTFFIKTNLPAVLSAVLNFQGKNCPALAKAYVYDVLLNVSRMHSQPALIGEAYSPSLKEDTRSFTRLRQTLGIRLSPDCWLQPTQRAADAEKIMQAWFEERKGRDYAAEIEQNYAHVANVHPLYVGYVGADGQAMLCHQFKKGDELWYMGQNGMSHDLRSETVYAQAVPYSPLFIKAKGQKKKH